MQGRGGKQGRHISGARATTQILRSPDAEPPVATCLGALESECREQVAQGRCPDRGQGSRSAFSDSSLGDAVNRSKEQVTYWVNSAPPATQDGRDICSKDQRSLTRAASQRN